ncbi:MAG: hypothetical protein QG596_646 [Actinomycetota bacterium]|jgi:uncharacterized membrane protein HdeD (DUF308 family)|nr:hypothetical protein [Actinomycetota bacterium]
MEYEEEVQKDVKRAAGLYTGLGVLLILLGAFAVLIPNVASWGMTVLIGWILVIGAAFLFAWSFTAPSALNVIARMAWSLLTLAAGLFLLINPDKGAKALTLILIIYFLLSGVIRLAAAFSQRGMRGAGWLGLSGALSLIIGLIFLADYPESADWAIGLLVGIDLIFAGWTLILLSREAKSEVLTE